MTLSVVIADDHAPTRMGVRMALEGDGFTVVGEASTAPAAVAAALSAEPDVILLDVHMPGSGIAAARTLTTQLPSAAVVMLTVSQDDNDLFEALRAGARGYLLKDIDPARLPHALRGVLDGEAALPRALVTRLMEEFRGRKVYAGGGNPVLQSLTPREQEVLELLRQGMSTKEIAARIFVAPVTVRTNVSQILKKLQVSDRDAAVRLANEG